MSVFYRLHQDQSVGTKRSGKWYARGVHPRAHPRHRWQPREAVPAGREVRGVA